MRRLASLSVLLVPLLLCLVACGAAGQNNPASTGATTAPTSAPTPIQGQLGQAVMLPGWQVTIERAKLAASNDGLGPDQPGDRLLILQVSLKNTSSASQPASDSPFYCRGSDGTRYSLIEAGNPGLSGPVAAGTLAAGQVVFEVPAGAHSFDVFYQVGTGPILAEWVITA